MSALNDDTILAVASPPGRSPRAILRCSGPSLADLIETLFGQKLEPRRLTAARLRLHGRGEKQIPVLAACFQGPRSYTGEDILEIQLPGNPALLDRVIQTILHLPTSGSGGGGGSGGGAGVRLAEPGEFTRRAYFAGRIDLTKAEGIAATISAVSDAQLAAAKLLRQGELGDWADGLTDQLADLLALVEAGIDFVDQEDVVPIAPRNLDDGLAAILTSLDQLLASSRTWKQIETLPAVVLVGPPNVGKSTLFNALLGRERAVTSEIAGTTRDVLVEPLQWRDPHGRLVEALLIDIAGLDPDNAAQSPLNTAMQRAAHDAIARAELILLLTDQSEPGRVAPAFSDRGQSPAHILRIGAKSDRITHTDVDLSVSAATGRGLPQLRQLIADRLADRAVTLTGEMLALQDRHLEALHDAQAALRETHQMLTPQRRAPALADMELIAGLMRHALNALGAISGRITPDELIGRVFAAFCVGK